MLMNERHAIVKTVERLKANMAAPFIEDWID